MGYIILIVISLPMIFIVGLVTAGLLANALGLVKKN
jgi:hypothetical protein